MSIESIMIAGGAGAAGRAYATALADAGYRVTATIRPGKSDEELQAAGVRLKQVDLRDPEGVDQAVKGVQAVVVAVLGRGADAAQDEEFVTGNIVASAVRHGVEKIVYTSVLRADEATGVPHFEVKGSLEREITASGIPFTHLRPATFMHALTAPWISQSVIDRGVLQSPIAIDAPISYLATADLAAFARLALERPELDSQTIELGGPVAVTYRDLLPILSDLVGNRVDYEQIPLDVVESTMGEDMAAMIRLFNREGFVVDMKPVLDRHPLAWTPVGDFLQRHWPEQRPPYRANGDQAAGS